MFCRFIAGHRYLDDIKSLNIIIFCVAKQTHNKAQKSEVTIFNPPFRAVLKSEPLTQSHTKLLHKSHLPAFIGELYE